MPARLPVKLLILFLATFVALVAAELVVRLVWHNPYRHEAADHVLKVRMHHPSTDHVFRTHIDSTEARVRLRTNQRSYIFPWSQFDHPDATVVFFGGSTTECLAVPEDTRFPALVSDLLAQDGLHVNTLNVARAGNNVHDAINVLINHVVTDQPDIAVLMEASNDIGVMRSAGGYGPSMGEPASLKLLAKWLVQITSSHSSLVGLVREAAIPDGLRPKDPATDWRQTAAPVDSADVRMYRSRLKAFVHICRDFDIVPVLMTQPYSRYRTALTPAWLDETAQDQFNDVIRAVGKSEGVLVIDLVAHLRADVTDWDQPNEIFYDAIHVTNRGSQVYAEYIALELRPLVAKTR